MVLECVYTDLISVITVIWLQYKFKDFHYSYDHISCPLMAKVTLIITDYLHGACSWLWVLIDITPFTPLSLSSCNPTIWHTGTQCYYIPGILFSVACEYSTMQAIYIKIYGLVCLLGNSITDTKDDLCILYERLLLLSPTQMHFPVFVGLHWLIFHCYNHAANYT